MLQHQCIDYPRGEPLVGNDAVVRAAARLVSWGDIPFYWSEGPALDLYQAMVAQVSMLPAWVWGSVRLERALARLEKAIQVEMWWERNLRILLS